MDVFLFERMRVSPRCHKAQNYHEQETSDHLSFHNRFYLNEYLKIKNLSGLCLITGSSSTPYMLLVCVAFLGCLSF